MKKMILVVAILISLVIISFSLEKLKKQNETIDEKTKKIESLKKEELVEEKRKIYAELKNTRTLMAMFPAGTEPKIVAGETYFDFDNDGFKEKTEWLGANEGILVKDTGINGVITGGDELFGDYTNLSGDNMFLRGFSMLFKEDTNRDGVIDVKDKNFFSLKIWMDTNHNAITEENELLPLSRMGISSINLSYTNVVDENGIASVRRRSLLNAKDKHKAVLEEVWVKIDPKYTLKPVVSSADYIVSDVPDVDVSGFGKVADLKTALHMDKTGILLKLVNKYLSESDIALRRKYLPAILVAWAGKEDVLPKKRGDFFDSRKLETLEAFNGRSFIRNEEIDKENSNPGNADVDVLSDNFQEYLRFLDASLASQTFYKDMFASIVYEYDGENGRYDFTVYPVIEYFSDVFNMDKEKGKLLVSDFSTVLQKIHEKDDLAQKILSRIASYGKSDGTEFEQLIFHIADKNMEKLPEDLSELPLPAKSETVKKEIQKEENEPDVTDEKVNQIEKSSEKVLPLPLSEKEDVKVTENKTEKSDSIVDSASEHTENVNEETSVQSLPVKEDEKTAETVKEQNTYTEKTETVAQ